MTTAVPIRRIFTLGPAGTFSDQAARRVERAFVRMGHTDAAVVFARTVPEVFQRTAAEPGSVGVVPIENSSIGTVGPAREGLMEHDVVIESELEVRVRFRLLGNAPLEKVTRLFSHPASYEQCGTFLSERLPNVVVTFTHSNTDSGDRLRALDPKDFAAAIVPVDYGDDVPELVRATTTFKTIR